MAQEIAFAAPRAEEMTKTVTGLAGAGITGAVEGVLIKMAPALGTLELPVKWGALIGIPAVGAAAALFTRGMLSDLFMGAACGGLGVVGYVLPELMAPITGQKAGSPLALAAANKVKLLPPGLASAPERAQAMAAVGVGYE